MSVTEKGEALRDKLGRKRERILRLLYREGEVRTSDIRRECDIPRGSKDYHLSILEDDHELITEAGRIDGAGGIPERVWTLTDDGRAFTEEWLTEDSDRPENHELRLERLERIVDRQDQEIDEVRDEVAEDITEKVNEWFQHIQADLEDAQQAAEAAADPSDIETVMSGLERLKQTIDGLQEDLEETTADVDDVKRARERDQREIAALTERVDELETILEDLRERSDKGMFSRFGGQ